MRESDNEIQDVLDQLTWLEPAASDAPLPARQALEQTKQAMAAQPSLVNDFFRSISQMANRRSIALGATLVIAIVALFMIPAVRATASDFLGLFRVQKFAPISVSPEQIALLEQLGEQGLNPGEFVMVDEPSEPEQAFSLEEAAARTGYSVNTLAALEALGPASELYVMDAGSGYLTIDLAGARAIVEAAGADPALLPDSLEGARIDVNIFPSVQQIWSDRAMLMQTQSPYVAYPEDVDPALLGQALLQVLGVDPVAAQQIAQTIDWTSTLLLPFPQDLATYQEVTVDGGPGVALLPLDGSNQTTVMWQRDGMVNMLAADMGLDELLSLANTLR